VGKTLLLMSDFFGFAPLLLFARAPFLRFDLLLLLFVCKPGF
jgi:hypothetical protein